MSEPTLNSKLSPAELCRRNGWGVGTRLSRKNEDWLPMTIEITAIGLNCILTRIIAHLGKPLLGEEGEHTTFCDFDWTLAPAVEVARVPAYNLKTVAFPECAKRCALIHLLGAGECDSVCPWKFDSDGNTIAPAPARVADVLFNP